jgi:hypothetical protein
MDRFGRIDEHSRPAEETVDEDIAFICGVGPDQQRIGPRRSQELPKTEPLRRIDRARRRVKGRRKVRRSHSDAPGSLRWLADLNFLHTSQIFYDSHFWNCVGSLLQRFQ